MADPAKGKEVEFAEAAPVPPVFLVDRPLLGDYSAQNPWEC
jgi:hypothetical protein